MAELHVWNDKYTRQWHLLMDVNWRDNSPVAVNMLACERELQYHTDLLVDSWQTGNEEPATEYWNTVNRATVKQTNSSMNDS